MNILTPTGLRFAAPQTGFTTRKLDTAPTTTNETALDSTRALLEKAYRAKAHYGIVGVKALEAGKKDALAAIKDPEIFVEVFSAENKHPSPEIQKIRKSLHHNKITSGELFGEPQLLANFYFANELALKEEFKNTLEKHGAENPKTKQTAIQLQIFKDASEMVAKSHPEVKLLKLEELENKPQSGKPKFGSPLSLFTSLWGLVIPPQSWRSRTKQERLDAAMQMGTVGSGAAGLTAGLLTKTFIADEAALTAITVGTVMSISKNIYGLDGVKESSLAVIGGKLLGARIATKILHVVPLVGEWANASSASALHAGTAALFVHMYESQIANGEEPHLPKELEQVLDAVNFAQLLGLNLSGNSQEELAKAYNDALANTGQADRMPTLSPVDNMARHTIVVDGRMHGMPNKDWWFNELVDHGMRTQEATNIAKKLIKKQKKDPKDFAQLLIKVQEEADACTYGKASKKLAKLLNTDEEGIDRIKEILEQIANS
jgi:uncharacterized protein (DUF697 family)